MSTIETRSFSNKALIAVALGILLVVIVLFLKTVFNVLLLTLAAVILAVYFRGFPQWIAKKTPLNETWSTIGVLVLTILLLSGFVWLLATRISEQVEQLRQSLPGAIEKTREYVAEHQWSNQIFQFIKEQGESLGTSMEPVKHLGGFFSSTFGVLGDLYIVIALGLFISISPRLYRNGIEKLIPKRALPRGREVLDSLWNALRGWLAGQLVAMIVVAILTAIGLMIMGIPIALTLAIIAGLLNFIPNFGPLIALIPALLVTLLYSPQHLWMVAILYIGVQVLESNLITPAVQKKMISLPPALILVAQVVMGVLAGFLGVLLALPVLALIYVLVQKLYIEDALGKPTGEKDA